MKVLFKDFFLKFPLEFNEMTVIKTIHKTVECAQKHLKKNKDGKEHLKYMAKAYYMLQTYFLEKGITTPEQYL